MLPYSEATAKELAVTWESQKYAELIETPGIPEHIVNPTPRGEVSELTKLLYAMTGIEVEAEA
ncbi:hypothetical protein CHI02_23880 [Niallia circulans]|nr:hypothetical protein CHI02_23880 [Niallia circulans]